MATKYESTEEYFTYPEKYFSSVGLEYLFILPLKINIRIIGIQQNGESPSVYLSGNGLIRYPCKFAATGISCNIVGIEGYNPNFMGFHISLTNNPRIWLNLTRNRAKKITYNHDVYKYKK